MSLFETWISDDKRSSSESNNPNWIFAIFFGALDGVTTAFRSDIFDLLPRTE